MTRRKNTLLGLLSALAVVALAFAVSGCGSRTTLAGDWADDGGYVVTADRCKADSMMINYDIEEGNDFIVISSELESGTLHITLGSALDIEAMTGDVEGDVEGEGDVDLPDVETELIPVDQDLVYDATGTGTETFIVVPGTYSLTVSGDDANPATGTVTIYQTNDPAQFS